uniref:hypothetical protein n=1 Tax=Gluconobacter sp. P1D12_c TaxID=2762614 RepID=UPI001C03A44B
AQRQDRRHPDPRAGGAAGEHGEDGRRSTCCSAGDRQAAPCFPSWLFMLLPVLPSAVVSLGKGEQGDATLHQTYLKRG